METNEKGFYGNSGNKWKARENVGPSLNGVGDLLLHEMEER